MLSLCYSLLKEENTVKKIELVLDAEMEEIFERLRLWAHYDLSKKIGVSFIPNDQQTLEYFIFFLDVMEKNRHLLDTKEISNLKITRELIMKELEHDFSIEQIDRLYDLIRVNAVDLQHHKDLTDLLFLSAGEMMIRLKRDDSERCHRCTHEFSERVQRSYTDSNVCKRCMREYVSRS